MLTLAKNGDSIYRSLQKHLDNQAVGFPATITGSEIPVLKLLFSPEQAELALHLSYQPRTEEEIIHKAAKQYSPDQVASMLQSAYQKGALGKKNKNGITSWFLIPMVVGMYESQDGHPSIEFFAASRAYMKSLAFKDEFLAAKPSQIRTVPVHRSITAKTHIATYDEIRSYIKSTGGPFVKLDCICRVTSRLNGNPCKQTSRLDTCLGIGDIASIILGRNHGQEISAGEVLQLLDKNESEGLVLQPSNSQNPQVVCSCCGCCCGLLKIQKVLPYPLDYWTSNYYARVDTQTCTGCGVCTKRCQVNAAIIDKSSERASINSRRCIGCGQCVAACPTGAISLLKKDSPTVPPETDEDLYNLIKANRNGKTNLIRQAMLFLRIMFKIRG